MSTSAEQYQKLWHKYQAEHDGVPESPYVVAKWAVDNGLLNLPVVDPGVVMMRKEWTPAIQTLIPKEYHLDQVLVEYDGPQVATYRGADGLHLGVAADDDTSLTRWIYSPITKTEYRALLEGSLTIRDALLKPQVSIVDVNFDGKLVCEWEIDSATIHESALPRKGARIPEAVRRSLAAKQPESPEICIDSIQRNKVGFTSLADLLSSVQRLWLAIAHARSADHTQRHNKGRWTSMLTEKASLSLASATAGSLVLQVEPSDNEMFIEVSRAFEALAFASDSADVLARHMSQLGQRVQSRYSELLGHLDKYGLQILARRPGGGSAFLASHLAPRIMSSLPKETVGEPRTVPAEGYFIAFNTRTQTFEFYDSIGEETYNGSVHPDVLAQNPSVIVGHGTTHTVNIEITNYITTSQQHGRICTLRSIDG